MRGFTVESRLRASRETLWEHATNPRELNHEFSPFLRMTFPEGVQDLAAGVSLGERVCRSWILLFGFLPVEYDDLTFVEIDPGHRFLERSSMLSQRRWEHERLLVDDGDGTRLTDRIEFEAKLRFLEPIYRLVFRATFAWRHHRLRARFGT